MTEPVQKPAVLLRTEAAAHVAEINNRLKECEYVFRPISSQGDVGTPAAFYTVGMTNYKLPEIYVSGITAGSHAFRLLFPLIGQVFKKLIGIPDHGITAQSMAKALNECFMAESDGCYFEARPIDVERMLYGQCMVLRYWLDDAGLRDIAAGVQVVWRNDPQLPFPVLTDNEQLLVDYVPFGAKIPNPPTLETVNASASA